MTRFVALGLSLLALGACTAESGAPDIGRGSADTPTTMLVDQTMNGVPNRAGTQRMVGASSWMPGATPVTRTQSGGTSFGTGVVRPLEPSGGQTY